jgi:predicted naringenin-chalcone synthase
MFISGIGTATPARRYLQKDCFEAARNAPQFLRLSPRSRALAEKVLTSDNGIVSRYLSLESLADGFESSPDALHDRFLEHAPRLAAAAAQRALQDAHLTPSDMDAVVISTCTGYLCPGLTSYVSELLGLRPDILALDLVGQGCVAAIPNLRTGESLVQSGRCAHVLSVCAEICSAAYYLDDDPGVLISACLFGDAAGAAVLSSEAPDRRRRIEWKSCGALLAPHARDLLRFEQRNGLLRNILAPEVPAVAADHAQRVLCTVLRQASLTPDDISTWIWHAGGRDVLRAVRDRVGLDDKAMRWSTAVLRDLGNVSSAFVYHVLDRALASHAPGGFWWLSAFGAGFSCQGALLDVEPL